MRSRIRRDPATEDAQTVERLRAALGSYLAEGGPGAAVSVGHILDLLNPRGMWSYDPDYRKARSTPAAGTDPYKDPLTGARWAGAPGTAPPSS
jgi:hypothetical protein